MKIDSKIDLRLEERAEAARLINKPSAALLQAARARYASGSGGTSYGDTQNFSLDPTGLWLAGSASGSATTGYTGTTGYSASASYTNDYYAPLQNKLPYYDDPALKDLVDVGIDTGFTGTASHGLSNTTSFEQTTYASYTPSQGLSVTGNAAATNSGATWSAFSASASFADSHAGDPFSAASAIEEGISGSGSQNTFTSVTQDSTFADGAWTTDAPVASAAGGSSENWSYAGSGSITTGVIAGSETVNASGSATLNNNYSASGTYNTPEDESPYWTITGSGSASGSVAFSSDFSIIGTETQDFVPNGRGGGAFNTSSYTGPIQASSSGSVSGGGGYSGTYSLNADNGDWSLDTTADTDNITRTSHATLKDGTGATIDTYSSSVPSSSTIADPIPAPSTVAFTTSFNFASPTNPDLPPGLLEGAHVAVNSIAGLTPTLPTVNSLWGMSFTADAAAGVTMDPTTGDWNGIPAAYPATTAPQTAFAVGNAAGATAGFSSEKLRAADAIFGSGNVDVLFPVTQAARLLDYGNIGIVAGSTIPGNGTNAEGVTTTSSTPGVTPAATPDRDGLAPAIPTTGSSGNHGGLSIANLATNPNVGGLGIVANGDGPALDKLENIAGKTASQVDLAADITPPAGNSNGQIAPIPFNSIVPDSTNGLGDYRQYLAPELKVPGGGFFTGPNAGQEPDSLVAGPFVAPPAAQPSAVSQTNVTVTTDFSAVPERRIDEMVTAHLATRSTVNPDIVTVVDVVGEYLVMMVFEKYQPQHYVMTRGGGMIAAPNGLHAYRLVAAPIKVSIKDIKQPIADLIATFRTVDWANKEANAIASNRNAASANATAEVVVFTYHLVPFGSTYDNLGQGNYLEAGISFAGDVAFFLPLAGAAKGVAFARELYIGGAAVEGGIAATRAGQGVYALQQGNNLAAAGYFGEAFLRLLGLSANTVAAIKVGREAAATAAAKAEAAAAEAAGREAGAIAQKIQQVIASEGHCFAAGTPVLTPLGEQRIETFKRGDQILTRPDGSPDAPVRVSVIEEVFELSAETMEIRVGGQTITTTGEHPFYVANCGWRNAKQLAVGDLLLGHDGDANAIESIAPTHRVEPVYNVRVAEDHTFFVGSRTWGFSVWVHNSYSVSATQAEDGLFYLISSETGATKVGFKSAEQAEAFAGELNEAIKDGVPQTVLNTEMAQAQLVNNQQAQLKGAIDSASGDAAKATARGVTLNNQGKAAQEISTETLNQIPGATVRNNRPIGTGEGSVIDNIVTNANGSKTVYVETKLAISTIYQRTINQLKNAIAKNGNAVVLQVARKPTPAEEAALKAALGATDFAKVKIVTSQIELYDYVKAILQ